MTEHHLDLRGVACPMNFVKTRLFLDKIAPGDVVTVLLDPGEPVESVSSSVQSEGHSIEKSEQMPGGYFQVEIKKASNGLA
ncbi:MAG TPA: sulfurtransferase TusA family protein [Planktothrix sp.]|jgi:TusA-related sulfurtransferase